MVMLPVLFNAKNAMSIDSNELKQIATLARLGLDEASIPQLTERMNEILAMADQLQDVDVSDIQPMAHPLEFTQRLREDQANAAIDREKLQTTAQATHEGLYLVPKVID